MILNVLTISKQVNGLRRIVQKTNGISSNLQFSRSKALKQIIGIRPFRHSQRFYSTDNRDLVKEPEKKQQQQQRTKSARTNGIWTLPNVLTMSRIATTPLIGYYILTQNLAPAMSLFVYSCVTDFLDGYLARSYKMKSVAGTVLDPMADKILMMTTTAALCVPSGPQIIPLAVAGLIFGRDLLLGLSAIYFRYASMKHRYGSVTWNSYWDIFHYPSAEVKPTQISKWNTFVQMIYVGFGVVLLIINNTKDEEEGKEGLLKENSQFAFTLLGYLVSVTTVWSGASYVFNKNAVRYLSKLK